ncbi:hypothetical protein Dimus_008718 [Dionaea muscipula]
MPQLATSTRYSLVNGERIVRFVLTARLRDCILTTGLHLKHTGTGYQSVSSRCGFLLFLASLTMVCSHCSALFSPCPSASPLLSSAQRRTPERKNDDEEELMRILPADVLCSCSKIAWPANMGLSMYCLVKLLDGVLL